MGGAVATLCALRLLSQLPSELHYTVRAVGFATPPFANEACQELAAKQGWAARLTHYMLPEDWVPNALTLWKQRKGGKPTVEAEQSSVSRHTLSGEGNECVCWGHAPAPSF